jgi:hypothetical protein
MLDTFLNFEIHYSVFNDQCYLGKIKLNIEHPTPNVEDYAA